MEKIARRSFFKRSTLALAAFGFLPAFMGCKKTKSDMNGMFVHHVFFWLKDADSEEVKLKFRMALEKLVSIDTIRFKHVGTPASTNRPIIESSYTYSLLVAFDDQKGHDVYQEHPIHDEFREKYHEMWERVLIYDSI
jgi:hypothetical protein